MSETGLSRLDLAARRSLVFASALVAVVLDLLPLPSAAPQSAAPLVALVVVYHWTVHRPDLFTPGSIFLLGLVRDLAGHLPLGLHASSFLLVPALLRRVPRGLLQRSLPLAWLLFFPIVAVVGLWRWLLAALVWMQPVPVRAFLLEALLSWAVYPLIVVLLAPVGRLLPRAGHVPGS
jgi:rod shape-determining protein MreD